MTAIYVATEDELSEAVAYRLVDAANHGLDVSVSIRGSGFGNLKNKATELSIVAQKFPVFLLTDLDTALCPPALQSQWLGIVTPPQDFLFRVAVREVEAWLMADREGFAGFLKAPLSQIPLNPESLPDPKLTLLKLVNRYGSRDQKAGIIQSVNSNLKQGLEYNLRLCVFVREFWSLENALGNADSLNRAYIRLRDLALRKAFSDPV